MANTWSRFSEENERIWRPGQHKRRRTRKTHFSEFAVFSAFCTKNGVVTKTGDIGKTFSGLKNLAVLQGFETKNPNELGGYRPSFLTTAVLLMVNVLPVAELSRPTLAAPVMLSELPDTAPVDDSAAPATVPVAAQRRRLRPRRPPPS